MENKFFTWKGWEDMYMASYFYDCEVVQVFGPFNVGQRLETVLMDYEEGVITVYDENNQALYKGKMKLVIE